MPTQEDFQESLTDFVAKRNFAAAVIVCYRAIEAGEDYHFWKTQMGYVGFQDDRSESSTYLQYTVALDAFEDLMEKYPNDANAIFWYGYISSILGPMGDEIHQQHNLRALSLDPAHPYANLSAASYYSMVGQLPTAIYHIQKCLELQPYNHRALIQLAKHYIALSMIEEARTALTGILDQDPPTETGYGALNGYINDVFISNHPWYVQQHRLWAREQLARLG